MSFRYLHLADLHLETPFGGRPRTRERLRVATLEAFERAVDLALEEGLHAVLVAGDAFDDPLLSLRVELRFLRAVRRLAEAGIWFLWVTGNHDPGESAKRAAGLGLEGAGLGEPWRRRVHLFRRAKPVPVVVTDTAGREVGVVVGAGHAREHEERNLAALFHPLDTVLPVVGLLHTQVESARKAELHDRYAPCSRADLERPGYDYWALGHVHLRQRPFDDLPAWYAGNLVGRNPKETGPKGGWIVELEAGAPAEPVFAPLAPVQWERRNVRGLASCASTHELVERLGRRVEEIANETEAEVIAVLELAGDCPLTARLAQPSERAELEDAVAERAGVLEVQLWPDELRSPRDLAALRSTPSVLGKALELCARAATDPELLESLTPPELAGLEGRERCGDSERASYLAELARGLEEELVQRCLGEVGR